MTKRSSVSFVATIVAIIASIGCGNINVPHGIPLGHSFRTANYIATLIETLEPYRVSLNHNPENERFSVGVFLLSADGRSPGRMIPIAKGLRVNEYRHDARILGDDGRLLWFHVKETCALELKTGKLFTVREIGTLEPNRRSNQPLESFFSSGAFVSATEWLGVHSPAEVERDLKPGSSLSSDNRAEKSAGPRRIYRGRIDASGSRPRIMSMTPISTDEYLHAALLRGPADSQPIRLSQPDGFLLSYTSPPNPRNPGTLFKGTFFVARMDVNGQRVWAVDTGSGDIEQILPDAQSMAFIGTRPRIPDKVPEPILVIVNNQSGAVSTTSLWQ